MYSAHFLQFVAHFNQGEYRACLDPLEEIWFVERDDFHKALIRLVVGLNQITLGLQSGPDFLLRTSLELLAPYGPRHAGIDLAALRTFIAERRAAIGATAETAAAVPYHIRLDPPRGASAGGA